MNGARVWISVCLLVMALGCGDVATKANNGGANNGGANNGGANNRSCEIEAPEHHRPGGESCDMERAAGEASSMLDGDCSTDADCTEGMNGRCLVASRISRTYCSYDQCITDGDCGDAVCRCGAAGSTEANGCYAGNCVTDADCGATGYCSPSLGSCGDYEGTVGYFCRTCADECVSDADCGGGEPGGPFCAFEPGVGHWKCFNTHCVG